MPMEELLAKTQSSDTVGVITGIVCVFDNDKIILGDAKCTGDIDNTHLDKYHRDTALAKTTFHPKLATKNNVAELRYGHASVIGDVLAYWHVHDSATQSVYLNAIAVIKSKIANDIVAHYLADIHSNVALSLGTFTLGHEEAIAELSVVLVPARHGCFGKITNNTEDTRTILQKMCYGTNHRVNTASFVQFAKTVDVAAQQATPTSENLLRTTADMLTTHRNLLRLTKTHYNTNVEKYINHGVKEYRNLIGDIGSAGPKVLTATMADQTALPMTGLAGNNTWPSMEVQKMLMTAGLDMLNRKLNTLITVDGEPHQSLRSVKRTASYPDDHCNARDVLVRKSKNSRRVVINEESSDDDDEYDVYTTSKKRRDSGGSGGGSNNTRRGNKGRRLTSPDVVANNDDELLFEKFQKFLDHKAAATAKETLVNSEPAPKQLPLDSAFLDMVKQSVKDAVEKQLHDHQEHIVELLQPVAVAATTAPERKSTAVDPTPDDDEDTVAVSAIETTNAGLELDNTANDHVSVKQFFSQMYNKIK